MRKDMWRRIAAVLLCLAMLTGCLAFADDAEVPVEPAEGATTVVEGAVTGADVDAAVDGVPQDDAADSTNIDDALPPEGGASEGDDVEQPGDDVEQPGDDVEQTGDDVEQTGDDVEQTGDDVEQTGDEDGKALEGKETDDGLVASAQEVAVDVSLNEDNGIMLMAAAPASCVDGHKYVDVTGDEARTGTCSLGPDGHTLTYETIKGKKCSVCGFFDPDSYEVTQRVVTEKHNYPAGSGSCSVCGYDCPHLNAVKEMGEWTSDMGTSPVSDEQHFHRGWRNVTVTCPDCNMKSVEEREYVEVLEDHTYSEASGMCIVCEYLKPKEGHVHKWQTYYYDAGDPMYDSIRPSAEGCVVTGVHRDCMKYCPECFTEMTIDYDPNLTVVWQHWFSGGACVRCGYRPDCKHERKIRNVVRQADTLLSGTIHDNGNGTHSGKYVETVRYTCLDCNYEETKTEVVEGIQACRYDNDGICVCGAKQHVHVPSGEVVIEPYGSSEFVEPIDNEDGTHTWASYKYMEYPICAICGEAYDRTIKEKENYTEPHNINPGDQYCICGFESTCEHELEARRVPNSFVDAGPKDQETHYVSYSVEYYCKKCNAHIVTEFDDTLSHSATVEEPHEWLENGVCRVCGAVRACDHAGIENTEPTPSKVVYKEIPGNDLQHQVIATNVYTCPICLATVTKEGVTTNEPHHYKNGKCTDEGCGHVCAHRQVDETCEEAGSWLVGFEKNGDATHLVVRQPMRWCSCGLEVPFGDTFTEPKAHHYKDGVCDTEDMNGNVCGHVCAHSNKIPDTDHATRVENDKPVSDNDDTHSTGYTLTMPWTCPDCKKSDTDVTQYPTGDPVKHSYKLVDGEYVCEACGRTCTHSGVTPVVETKVAYPEAGISQYGHIPSTTTTTTIDCPHGHDKIVTSETVEGVNEAHKYDDKGVCTDCGFACAHPMTVQEEEPRNIRYTSNGAQGHTVTYDMCNVTRCYYCNVETEEPEVINAGVTETEAHSFSGDTCALCGYKQPAAPRPTATPAPTEQPVVTDEPVVFEEVAPEVPVHGVTADSNTRMATALVQAIDGIESDYGASATVEIRDAEKVFTAQESATFTKLPVQEQMLVLLSVLGYEDEVYTGMNEAGITLSAEAEDLIRTTYERITAMDEAEFAQFMAMVGEIFPVTQSADGQHMEITLEIRNADGTVRYERYGFDFVDEVWVFSKLEVAENTVSATAA